MPPGSDPGPTAARGWPRVLETALASLTLTVAAIGVALMPIMTPPYVRVVVAASGAGELTGLGTGKTLELAESLRRFVVDPGAPALPATVNGQAAFDAAAVSHLIDVRNVLAPAIALTVALVIAGIVWALWRRRTPEGRAILGRALRIAGGALIALVVLVGSAALVDFDGFFAAFHGLFFDAGTWVFPADALLIKILPLPFWTTAAATWGGLILAEGLILTVIGRRTRFTISQDSV